MSSPVRPASVSRTWANSYRIRAAVAGLASELVEQLFAFRVSHETADRDLRADQRFARRAARRREPVRR